MCVCVKGFECFEQKRQSETLLPAVTDKRQNKKEVLCASHVPPPPSALHKLGFIK